MRRLTKQREAVLKIINSTQNHPTAERVYQEVRKEIPNISKGTVYRNLRVLQEMGLIYEISLSGAISRFEPSQEKHYHFKCDSCGRVVDLDEPANRGLEKRIARKTGFKVYGHRLELFGLCQKCQTARSSKNPPSEGMKTAAPGISLTGKFPITGELTG